MGRKSRRKAALRDNIDGILYDFGVLVFRWGQVTMALGLVDISDDEMVSFMTRIKAGEQAVMTQPMAEYSTLSVRDVLSRLTEHCGERVKPEHIEHMGSVVNAVKHGMYFPGNMATFMRDEHGFSNWWLYQPRGKHLATAVSHLDVSRAIKTSEAIMRVLEEDLARRNIATLL